MWPAARTYMLQKHQMWMDEVFEYSSDVKPWLDEHHNLLWARNKFSCQSKCEYINNNMAESWNAWIKASKGLGHLKVTKGDPYQAEVTEIHNDEELTRHVVHLDKCTCTCREWQVTEKPCQHALAVITTVRQPNMEKYVDKAFSVLRFQAAYASTIPNITDKKQWPQVEKEFKLLAPVSNVIS
uniref:OSJNBb0018J12.11 protein n=1 Tax=Oryza sativa subsp. japonica TaxID=39947 RepID=Q7XM48_ORYSJ|nr:OSJNBb0018J12.11 [Oryza sativa Japonica Group]